MSLIMLVDNIKRCANIPGIPSLIAKLQNWKPDYTRITCSTLKGTKPSCIKPFYDILFFEHKPAA